MKNESSLKKKPTKPDTSVQNKSSQEETVWQEALSDISINDPHWWCIVTMLVETTSDHARCISLFNSAAAEGRRRQIYALSHRDMITNVKMLSKPGKCLPMQRVCHHANKVLAESDGEMPTWVMAWLIKYLVYRAKAQAVNQVKKEEELERQIVQEYRIMQTAGEKNAKGGKGGKGGKAGKVGKGKRADGRDYVSKRKANTRLRRPGEEWRDIDYIEDAPVEGPNLYIILTGFYDPDLPAELVKVGVPLSCLLKIKRPGEHLECHDTYVDVDDKMSSLKRKAHASDTLKSSNLHKFWTSIEMDLADPVKSRFYDEVAFITFCPPNLPDDLSGDEHEKWKQDTYNRVSHIVFDLYDLLQNYSLYLTSMKIESRIIDVWQDPAKNKIYYSILDSLPTECVTVPIVLHAMLRQVEHNFASLDDTPSLTETTEEIISKAKASKIDFVLSKIVQNAVYSLVFREKLRCLDIKYDIQVENKPSIESLEMPLSEISLILHGDTFAMNTHHIGDISKILDPSGASLADIISRILWDPRICELWSRCKDLPDIKVKGYTNHMNAILRYFDEDVSIDLEGMFHHLHILFFRRAIKRNMDTANKENKESKENTQSNENNKNGENKDKIEQKDQGTNKRNEKNENEEGEEVERKAERVNSFSEIYNIRLRSYTEPAILISKEALHVRRTESDSVIDYEKSIPELLTFSQLFDFVDARRIFATNQTAVPSFENDEHPATRFLEEYDSVELLSKSVFFQAIHDCFEKFGQLQTMYVEPTDKILILFTHDSKGICERTTRVNIRTPVPLREFCEYVIPEEREWIKQIEEKRILEEKQVEEGHVKKVLEEAEKGCIYTDEYFVFRNSLKEKYPPNQRQSETETPENDKNGLLKANGNDEEDKNNKLNNKQNEINKTRNSRILKEDDLPKPKLKTKSSQDYVDTSFLPLRKVLSFECAKEDEPYDFLSYDLGRIRVQLDHTTKIFLSADGTVVRVERKQWLYAPKHLLIAVTFKENTLRLLHEISDRLDNEFHFTAENGIILAFQRNVKKKNTNEELVENDWEHLNCDFRASWPSGLLIEPVKGDGPDNPFYIRQLYLAKGLECADIAHEISRKFLRNGTVLKYMDDDSIIILRPNGDIVTCTDFFIPREDEKSVESKSPRRRKKIANADETQSRDLKNDQITEQPSELSFIEPPTCSVTKYTVLHYDGRHQEVRNDQVVREYDRLLVRTTSDYEVDEKFTRRADGTATVLRSNGELIVDFTDGTRITTSYSIEEELVICDWSQSELRQFFSKHSFPSMEQASYQEDFEEYMEGEDGEISISSIEDGFVSVLLNCRMEHRNYATVVYGSSEVDCHLSMPGDLQVSISREGHYEVSMASQLNLKVENEGLRFSWEMCTGCGMSSIATYAFPDASGTTPRTIFTSVDVFGNIFEVREDGETLHESGKEKLEIECEACRTFLKTQLGTRCRMFAMNRDFTAHEYHPRSVRVQQETTVVLREGAALFLHPIPHRPKLQRLITFLPCLPETKSKAFLQLYQMSKFQPTNYERTDLLRSTYCIPYNWLCPYGWNGNGIWKKMYSTSTCKRIQDQTPSLLEVRILCPFQESNRSAIVDFQRALTRYWITILRNDWKSYSWLSVEKENGRKEITNKMDLENYIRDLALGIKAYIGLTTYIDGLRSKKEFIESLQRPKKVDISERLNQFFERQRRIKKEVKWYNECLRNNVILAYFRNTVGTCFLWVNDCVEDAVRISNLSHPEKQDSDEEDG